MFNALLITNVDGQQTAQLTDLNDSDLPDGDVVVEVEYSSINYKDALAITGQGPVIRQFPMVPGIDLAGTVGHSDSDMFHRGESVLLTGWGIGESHWGGLAQKARVNSQWLTPIPPHADAQHVMAIGTAGFTAVLCVEALQRHGVTPAQGPVLVTGASGGVGSCAALILSTLGYEVIAATGRPAEKEWLLTMAGVSHVIERSALDKPGRPLQKERWAAAIDTVGSHTLYNACAGTQYGGIVAACGMAQGMALNGSVAPFILRGITLKGIDSVHVPPTERPHLWEKAVHYLPMSVLAHRTTRYPLNEVVSVAEQLLAGEVSGRALIHCQ